jgi:hypothetical protein
MKNEEFIDMIVLRLIEGDAAVGDDGWNSDVANETIQIRAKFYYRFANIILQEKLNQSGV